MSLGGLPPLSWKRLSPISRRRLFVFSLRAACGELRTPQTIPPQTGPQARLSGRILRVRSRSLSVGKRKASFRRWNTCLSSYRKRMMQRLPFTFLVELIHGKIRYP